MTGQRPAASPPASHFDATLAALPRPRHRRALGVGCSMGVLTLRQIDCPRGDSIRAVQGLQ